MKAREIITARGNPSGTATTIIVTPTMMYSNHQWRYVPIFSPQLYPIIPCSMKNLRNKTETVMKAANTPMYPMLVAIDSSFY